MQRQWSHQKAITYSEGAGQPGPPVTSRHILLAPNPRKPSKGTGTAQTVSQKGQQPYGHCRTPSKSLASEGHSGTFQASHFPAVAVVMDVYTAHYHSETTRPSVKKGLKQ